MSNRSKLGIFITDSVPFDNAVNWFTTAKPLYALFMSGVSRELVQACLDASPQTIPILRKYFGEGDQKFDDPVNNAAWCWTQMQFDRAKFHGLINTIMSWNEPAVWNDTDARNLVAFENEFARLAHAGGLKTIAYNFPEGNPADLSLWNILVNVDADYIGVHEYDAPTMFAEFPWHCGRFQNIPGDKPLLITECGIDFKVQHNPQDFIRGEWGWKHASTDVSVYLNQSLKRYDALLQKYPRVKGALIFAHAWNMGSGTYDVKDEPTIAQYIGEEQMPPVTVMLTDVQRAQIIVDIGFPRPDIALAISLAENGNGDPNGNTSAGNNPPTSVDRGLWKINNHWHPEVTDACAHDPVCSTKEAFRISNGGTDFRQWSTWASPMNNYKVQLPRARAALKQVTDVVLNAGIDAAKDLPHIAVNDQAWLYKFGIANGAGLPERDESEPFLVNGIKYIYQEWSLAHLLMVQGRNDTARLMWK